MGSHERRADWRFRSRAESETNVVLKIEIAASAEDLVRPASWIWLRSNFAHGRREL